MQVDEHFDNIESTISEGTYFPINARLLAPDSTSISDVWPAVPSRNHLHIFAIPHGGESSILFSPFLVSDSYLLRSKPLEGSQVIDDRILGVDLNFMLERGADGWREYFPRG